MSVLSSRQIKHAIDEHKLIEPDPEQLSVDYLRTAWESGLNRIEGVNFELSLGAVFKKVPGYRDMGFIGVSERRTPSYVEVPPDTELARPKWYLDSGFYELKTFETVSQPLFLASRLVQKRTLVTFGAALVFADVAPGFSGKLGIGLYVFPDCIVPIERGALFMSISFATIDDAEGVTSWDGVWKDNRLFLEKSERPR